jgi:Family of unknown function (DUF6090)
MIKYFRKIRQKLLIENKFSKYLIYAIGEILIIVIGVLFAVQINNLNQSRKTEVLEKSVLIDLRSELYSNISILDSITNIRKNVLAAGRLVLEQSGPDASWDSEVKFDSLLFKIVLSGWKFFPESGVVTDILNSGKLNVIQNDSLRYMISSLPSDIALLNDEDDTYRLDLHGYFVPFFSGNYAIRNIVNDRGLFGRDMDLGVTAFRTNPESLLRNQELEGVLTIQAIWTNTAIGLYDRQLKNYKAILSLINQELEL